MIGSDPTRPKFKTWSDLESLALYDPLIHAALHIYRDLQREATELQFPLREVVLIQLVFMFRESLEASQKRVLDLLQNGTIICVSDSSKGLG